jgi:medium-chain acyl-[acyl-carrier-protein] hydrolase
MTQTEPMKKLWTDYYNVHSWEADLEGKIKIPILFNYMQESAWRHAENLQLGFSSLIKKNLVWVLARQTAKIENYPKWGDRIRIDTWPVGIDRLFFFRDFKISSENGDLLGTGTTTWFVIDIQSRRPQKPDKFLEMTFEHLQAAIPEHSAKLGPLDKIEETKTRSAGFFDMDVNKHVNNVRYIEWVLESYSFEFMKNHSIKELTVNHLAEAQAGDEICINTDNAGDGIFNHSITFKESGKEMCRAQIIWNG